MDGLGRVVVLLVGVVASLLLEESNQLRLLANLRDRRILKIRMTLQNGIYPRIALWDASPSKSHHQEAYEV